MRCKKCGSENVALHKNSETNTTVGFYCLTCNNYEENKYSNTSKPDHYNGMECANAISIATDGLDGYEGFCTGNVMKYMWRWKKKNGIDDLNKAMNYIQFLIDYEEIKNDHN